MLAALFLALAVHADPIEAGAPEGWDAGEADEDAPALGEVSPDDPEAVLAAMRAHLRGLRGVSAPIINGTDATEDDYPMAGAMLIDATWVYQGQNMQFRYLMCSSTLIAPDTVLMAGHCVDWNLLTQGYGTLDVNEIVWTRAADLTAYTTGQGLPDWPEDAVAAWGYVQHPGYDENFQLGVAKNDDLSLLFLEEPVLDVPHAYLITEEESSQVVEGATVEVVGWGQQTAQTNPPPGTYGTKQMGESYIAELGDWEFQVGLNPEDVRKCHGDSGGPTFMEVVTDSPETLRQIGVTSHSYDYSDCRRTGGVDTRVDAFLDWIDSEMRARCDSGERVWCDVPGIVPPPEPPPPEDTADTADTGAAEGEGGTAGGGGGCGCSSAAAPSGGLWGLFLLGAALLRRRERAR